MQFLANLSQNQRIGLIAGVLVVLFLIIFFTTRKQSYEEMKKEMKKEEMKALKEYVETQPENIKMKQYNHSIITADMLPAKLIDGSPLYTELPLGESEKFNIVFGAEGLNIPVERVFYDDVDFWFVGSHKYISYVLAISPDDVSPLQYRFKGTPDQLPELDPSDLRGFKELNQLALINSKNPQQNLREVIQQMFRQKSSLLPNLTQNDKKQISNIGINADLITMPLFTNEMAFRRAIRNARLKLREMERKNESLTYQDKMNLINNTILEFMLQGDVIRNFDMASQELSKFNFDCRMIQLNSRDKDMVYAFDKILGTYKNMLNRLFSAVMTNSEKYLKHCSQDPQLLQSYQNIVNSLRFIVSNKEFLSQVCPVCPDMSKFACPDVQCPACPHKLPSDYAKPEEKKQEYIEKKPMPQPQPMPQPMPQRNVVDLPTFLNNSTLFFHGANIGPKGNGVVYVNRVLYSIPDRKVYFFTSDGDFIKIIIFDLKTGIKETGYSKVNKKDHGKYINSLLERDQIVLKNVILNKPSEPSEKDGYKVGVQNFRTDGSSDIIKNEVKVITDYLNLTKIKF